MNTILFFLHILAAKESGAPFILTGILGVIVITFLIVLAVLSMLMPFFVFAINNKMDKLNRTADALLQAQNNTIIELHAIRTGGNTHA